MVEEGEGVERRTGRELFDVVAWERKGRRGSVGLASRTSKVK